MPRPEIKINGDVLAWAMDEGGFSIGDLASKVPRSTHEVIQSWIEGNAYPSKGQLSAIGRALKRPSAIFFLTDPPRASAVPIALRTARGRRTRELDQNELRQVRRAKRMQNIIRWVQTANSIDPGELPTLRVGNDPASSGRLLREWAGIVTAEQLRWSNPKQAIDSLRQAFADRGVVVLQLSLGKRGFRGFSLPDEISPVIAVTTAENLQARMFTLFHELAHLATDSAASCLPVDVAPSQHLTAEKWCDEVSSASLLPSDEVVRIADSVRRSSRPPADDVDWVRRVSNRFSMSLRATAVAMIRAGLLGQDSYGEIELAAPVSDIETPIIPGRGGQRAPARRLSELGPWASGLILKSLNDNKITELEARRYLKLDGNEIGELADAIGMPR